MKRVTLFCLAALMLASAACTQQVMLPIQSPTLSALAGTPSQPPTPAATPSPIPTPAPLAPAYMEQTIDQVLDYSEFLAEVNAKRKAAIKTDTFMNMSEYLQPYEDTLDLLSSDEIEMLLMLPKDASFNITQEQALEDIDYLFKLLKCGYGPYFYFGGDEAFDAAKESLLASLPQSGEIKTEALVKDMANHLSFITDAHFSIDGAGINVNSIVEWNNGFFFWYINNDQFFSQDEQGWYKLYGNEKWRVIDIDVPEGASCQYVPTIDAQGRIVYTLSVLMEGIAQTQLPISITLTYAEREYKYEFPVRPMETKNYYDFYSLDWNGSIPIVTLRGFNPHGYVFENALEDFVKSGKQVRNNPLLIIDIRANGGGNSHYAERWVEGYTSSTPQDKYFSAQRISKLPHPMVGGRAGKWGKESKQGKWISLDSSRIVLTDKAIGSAGEGYVFMLRTLNNSLFVGSNTIGCVLSGNASDYYLPKVKELLRRKRGRELER